MSLRNAYLALLCSTFLSFGSGCSGPEKEPPGAHAHGPNGEHLAEGDHPGEAESELEPSDQIVTQFGETTELFVEFPALVKDRGWPFAVHLTRLSDFKALTEGTVTVVLTGSGAPDERFVQEGPSRPGYFRTVVTPKYPGLREVVLSVRSGDLIDRHDLGPYPVYSTIPEAIASEPVDDAGGGADEISFLKEQQWKLDFRLDEVKVRKIRPSLRANGTLGPRHHGEAWVSAPRAGRLLVSEGDFPNLGMRVEKDQPLALLALPLHESGGDPATLELGMERSRVEYASAEKNLKRMQDLFRQKAVPERRVIEAKTKKDKAWAELSAAKRRLGAFQAMQRSQGEGVAGQIELRAPIAGSLVGSNVVPGVFVSPGDKLFHLMDLQRLWLEVHVPASLAPRVENAVGAWFELEGSDRMYEVSAETGGRLVTIGGLVNPGTRTVSVIFELENPDGSLRAGSYADVRVITGPTREAVVLPRSALVQEDGKTVAYVQLSGESFERRLVTLGLRDGGWVEVLSGVDACEILVTQGAYYVRLAAAGGAVPSHGHAH